MWIGYNFISRGNLFLLAVAFGAGFIWVTAPRSVALIRWVLSRVHSTPLHRWLFIRFARFDARLCAGGLALALTLAPRLLPAGSRPAILILGAGACASYVVSFLVMRLNRRNGLQLSSMFGRYLEVHVPEMALSARDFPALKRQVRDTLEVAFASGKKSIHLNSPLLVANSTVGMFERLVRSGALAAGRTVSVEIAPPHKVSDLALLLGDGYLQRYEELRTARIDYAVDGRLLSRKIIIRFD